MKHPSTSTPSTIETLKERGEDFEYYPTTPQMVEAIYNNINDYNSDGISILDIGAGRGDFYVKIKDLMGKADRNNLKIAKYSVIEKSQHLLSLLPEVAHIAGVDFDNTVLIDKSADVIFCNPPYSDFKNWTKRILKEACFKKVFMIIPERWAEDKDLVSAPHTIIYTGDFFDAERKARAKVQVVMFNTKKTEGDVFFSWFKDTFDVDKKLEEVKAIKETQAAEDDAQRQTIVNSSDKIGTLIELYLHDLTVIQKNITYVMKLDPVIFKELNININLLAESLRDRLKGLKLKYWHVFFENVDAINKRLTAKNRREFFNRFQENNVVDFNLENISAVIMWVLKNAEQYYNQQIVDMFKALTEPASISNYKSNQKIFAKDRWRFKNEEHSHFKLDYRIVQDSGGFSFSEWDYKNRDAGDQMASRVNDFIVIASNAGFPAEPISPLGGEFFGKKMEVYQTNGELLLDFTCFKKGSIHYRLNQEFCKFLNIEAGRLLGWLRTKADVVKETGYSVEDAEKYFGLSHKLTMTPNQFLQITGG